MAVSLLIKVQTHSQRKANVPAVGPSVLTLLAVSQMPPSALAGVAISAAKPCPSPCQLQNEHISTQKLPPTPTQGAAAPAATALGEVSIACPPPPTCPFSLLSQVSGRLLVTLVIYTQMQLLHVQLKLQPQCLQEEWVRGEAAERGQGRGPGAGVPSRCRHQLAL